MNQNRCSVTKYLEIVQAGLAEYDYLSRFHYRPKSSCPYAAIYAIKDTHPGRSKLVPMVGVIVYTMPAPQVALRNIATGGMFCGFGERCLQLQMVNKYVRCISRVIIEPRYRGLGLASRLVAETMGKVGATIVEAMAVMGAVHPFFEKAGMKRYEGKASVGSSKLVEAMEMVGIDQLEFIDPQAVQDKLDKLRGQWADFMERQISDFLGSYGKRSRMAKGIERTKYALSKLSGRPVYYIWFDPSERLSPLRKQGPRILDSGSSPE
jgi:GNAT superfamily N-acetyltransferase